MMKKIGGILAGILGARWFLWVVVGFFVFEALWIALSSYYPMAFDEEFHFGIIKLYAQGWAPWLPPDAGSSGAYGAVTADPSFLFHWLMSFPYRLITLFTDSQTIAVILLRVINIGLFTVGMLMFYRLMRAVGTSAAFSNAALALFALIPVVPLLAGQINYDNLLMIITAGLFLLAVALYRGFREGKFDIKLAALFVAACVFGSINKYAFLPLAVAAFVFVAAAAWYFFRKRHAIAPALRKSLKTLSVKVKIGLLVLLLAGFGLAFQRYGLNFVSYGTPLPKCDNVLSVDQCLNYGPWARNYRYAQNKGYVNPSPLYYTGEWLKGMHKRLFFMINGPHHHYYQNYPPPPILANTATALAIGGFIAVVIYWRRVFRNPLMIMLFGVSLFYSAVLWYTLYKAYLNNAVVVAVNGRYLIPVLLPLAAVAAAALHQAFRRIPSVKPWLVVAAILLFLQGGGVLSFILRSDNGWYWENDTVIETNNTARKIIDPVIYQGRD